jgi:hypothetical protein
LNAGACLKIVAAFRPLRAKVAVNIQHVTAMLASLGSTKPGPWTDVLVIRGGTNGMISIAAMMAVADSNRNPSEMLPGTAE